MSGIPPFPTPPQAQLLDGQTGPFPGSPELGSDAARSAANINSLTFFDLSLRARGVGPFGFEAVGVSKFKGSVFDLIGKPRALQRAPLRLSALRTRRLAFLVFFIHVRAREGFHDPWGLLTFFYRNFAPQALLSGISPPPRRPSAAPRLFKTPSAARGGKSGRAPACYKNRIEKFRGTARDGQLEFVDIVLRIRPVRTLHLRLSHFGRHFLCLGRKTAAKQSKKKLNR